MSDSADDRVDGLLRAARPVRNDDYLRPGEDAAAEALLKRITSIPPRRRWRWKRITFFVAGGCVVVGAGAATAVLRSRSPEDPTTIGCYSSAVVDAGQILQANADSDRTAIEVCEALWASGAFGSNVVPELLSACVTEDEITVVLPASEAVCAERGWDIAVLAEGETADPATELLAMLSDRFGSRQCISREEAVDIVKHVFDELGLDWEIDDRRAVDGCNTAAPEVPNRTVAIVANR